MEDSPVGGSTESRNFQDVVKSKPWVPVLMSVGGAVLLLILVWLICRCRRRSRYDYSVIKEERGLFEKWQEEKRIQATAERDAMLLNCYFYFKDSDKFSVVNNLPEIGSRVDKYWFNVRESKSQTDALLSILPWSKKCVLPITKSTKASLAELFSALQHPYLLPILYVDIVWKHQLVTTVQPFKPGGSLKDAIHGARPKGTFAEKYRSKGKGLSLNHIRNYGRQVLEALLYLKEKGLPSCANVHSGNIFVVNGTCKLSGYESALLGFTSRLYPIVRKLLKEKSADIDVILFGHLLFEMSAGYELTAAAPETDQLVSCRFDQVVEVLKFIFQDEEDTQYPTLEELADHTFFEKADVRGLQRFDPHPVRFSSGVKLLLKLYRTEGARSIRTRSRKSSRRKSKADNGDLESNRKERKQSTRSKSKVSSVTEVPAVQFHQSAPRTSTAAPSVPVPSPPSSGPSSALLSAIRKGTKLKKNTTVNDKSKPRL